MVGLGTFDVVGGEIEVEVEKLKLILGVGAGFDIDHIWSAVVNRWRAPGAWLSFSWLQEEGSTIVAGDVGFVAQSDPLDLGFHPILHLGNRCQAIGNLERL